MSDAVRRRVMDLVEALRSKLAATSPDYRALAYLQKALAEMEAGARTEPGSESAGHTGAGAQKRLRTAVYELLSREAGPLPISEIQSRIEAAGVAIHAKRPRAALSSNLSQDRRFENVVVNGRPMWRIKASGGL